MLGSLSVRGNGSKMRVSRRFGNLGGLFGGRYADGEKSERGGLSASLGREEIRQGRSGLGIAQHRESKRTVGGADAVIFRIARVKTSVDTDGKRNICQQFLRLAAGLRRQSGRLGGSAVFDAVCQIKQPPVKMGTEFVDGQFVQRNVSESIGRQGRNARSDGRDESRN